MPKKILIVDDDPAIVAFLEDLLRDNDYSTCAAYSCAEGLEKVRKEKPDLVLLDMEMPDKGGTMFYVNMRKEGEIKDTPVVVVSGVGPRPPALRKGIPTIEKPVNVSLLLSTVAERIA
ncbi:response regulator [Desulfovibrio psychrotolerans]|uniref:Response regulator n=1 Tax=Desulfovibrio psychrotolerans TaxID=415242 RepID=A0A7J0BRM3_9BACT|nr:response regulator [Desulfovibrio psychrotolerans]GFM35832.1 response regulator [Desulfovibrio psychrotolerans]